MIYYYGTSLENAGHYLWEIEGDGIYNSRVKCGDLPFNPEGLPYRKRRENFSNGHVQVHKFCGFTICAIEGSCRDTRPASKSIFFIEGDLSDSEMKDKILSIPMAKKIIEKMPFEVKWSN